MRNHDLFSLALFVNICETRSISRAAERMNIVASAASRRVGLLEHEAGLPLLLRRPHGVEPTAAGMIVLRYARDVMHLGQQVEAALEDHRSGASGIVRVFASSSVLVECLASHLAADVGLAGGRLSVGNGGRSGWRHAPSGLSAPVSGHPGPRLRAPRDDPAASPDRSGRGCDTGRRPCARPAPRRTPSACPPEPRSSASR